MNIPNDKLLFIFEMANNHMGQLDHGLRIIRELHQVSRGFDFHFAFKFQYRHLDTFIHPEYRGRSDIKYVKRFCETRLAAEEFRVLKSAAEELGFITVCTPFDEASVDLILEHGIAIIKVASCSFTDWPLLEHIVKTDRPLICSTAGVPLEDIDKVVSFLEHRRRSFALMHCVAEYPTRMCNLELNQIRLLRSRYPRIQVGYSTHEPPDLRSSIQVAIAQGATVFEKHVGVPTADSPLNAYSAAPGQIRSWLESAREAMEMCGTVGKRYEVSGAEAASLRALRRGVFAKRAMARGQRITLDDVMLAIPVSDGQLTANDLSKYTEFRLQSEVGANEPLLHANVSRVETRERVYAIVCRVREVLKESKVAAPGEADLEISHHYGLDHFDEYGITMITVVNRAYCKKLLIVLPGQKHPEQYHKVKEESFHILWGEVSVNLDGVTTSRHRGDLVVIEPGVKHSFASSAGAVIEEISSTHCKDDSYYTDSAITENKDRKTLLTYWME